MSSTMARLVQPHFKITIISDYLRLFNQIFTKIVVDGSMDDDEEGNKVKGATQPMDAGWLSFAKVDSASPEINVELSRSCMILWHQMKLFILANKFTFSRESPGIQKQELLITRSVLSSSSVFIITITMMIITTIIRLSIRTGVVYGKCLATVLVRGGR